MIAFGRQTRFILQKEFLNPSTKGRVFERISASKTENKTSSFQIVLASRTVTCFTIQWQRFKQQTLLLNQTVSVKFSFSTLSTLSTMSFLVLKAALLVLFMVVGSYSNGRVIHTVLVADALRPVLNLLVASLSFADFLTCVFIMPFSFASLVSGHWLFGSIFCSIQGILLLYFAHVAGLSTWAIVYEKYLAISRRRFPSLSYRRVGVLLCIAWIFPVVVVAPMGRHHLSYSRPAAVCLDTYQKDKNWDKVCFAKNTIEASLGLFLALFSFWKILAYLFPIRRRVSPGLLSNEEKLTVAAHVRSAWTTIIFVFIYTILALPFHVARTIDVHRKINGKLGVNDNIISAFLWLYWLQCAIKPVIYVARSERCSCRSWRFYRSEENEELVTQCFWSGNRASTYKVNEVSSVNNESNLPDDGRSDQVFPSLEFLDICRIPSMSLTSQTALPSYSQNVQDEPTITGQTISHSMVMREELIMKSDVKKSEDEGSCDGRNTIPEVVCHDAVELENIERVFDEALQLQEREWENSTVIACEV